MKTETQNIAEVIKAARHIQDISRNHQIAMMILQIDAMQEVIIDELESLGFNVDSSRAISVNMITKLENNMITKE